MGAFVDKQSVAITIPSISAPDKIQGEGVWVGDVTPSSPYKLVNEKFNETMFTAKEMLARLVGSVGEWVDWWEWDVATQTWINTPRQIAASTGYLPALENIIKEFPTKAIDGIVYNNVTIGTDISTTVIPAPEFGATLDLVFPTFDTPFPGLSAIPSVDLSAVLPLNLPADITAAISWFESAHDEVLYTALFNKLIADMTSGAGGLGGTVEQELYDRALARQAVDNDSKYREIEEYFSSRGFDLPTGAMAGRLQEQANVIAANNLEINGKILIEQAGLAQKNQQFVIDAAKGLEALLRDYDSKKNDRSLDYSKAVAANAIAIYAERIKAYISTAEANKMYVEVQVENLKAVVESNKGKVAAFAAEADAYGMLIGAKAKKNEAITDVYKAEVMGYDSETRAISENQKNIVAAYELKIKDADADLRAAIAAAEASVRGYTSEYGLREKVAESMANIAMQAMASAYGAVNASAGLSYSGGESVSESWSHGESRSDSYAHSESISNAAGISVALSNSLTESHDFTE